MGIFANQRPKIALVGRSPTSDENFIITDDDRKIVTPLNDLGYDTEAVIWSSEEDWNQYVLVVLRACWDKQGKTLQYENWMRNLPEGVLHNPLGTWEYEKGKTY